jgi:hypothetical protein
MMFSGAAGGGKSILSNMIATYCAGYKWIDGSFQSDQIVVSSSILVEEVRLEMLKEEPISR